MSLAAAVDDTAVLIALRFASVRLGVDDTLDTARVSDGPAAFFIDAIFLIEPLAVGRCVLLKAPPDVDGPPSSICVGVSTPPLGVSGDVAVRLWPRCR